MRTLSDYVAAFEKVLAEESFGDKTVRMDIDELGSIHIEGATVSTEEKSADCILRTDHGTYDQLFSGTLDPTIAFGQGALKMDGEMGVALQVQPLFKKAFAIS